MPRKLALSSIERQAQIHQFIEQSQRASIEQICQHFAISMATARRDLDTLAKNGRIQRIHGGAIAIHSAPPEPPLLWRSKEQAAEKQRIGHAAAALVQDGDTVFLGSGTTVLEVAYHLRNHTQLTIITNSMLVMSALVATRGVQLVSLGGVLRQSEMSFIGHLTEQAAAELRADKVFMGIRAVDAKHGLTNDYLPETQTDRALLNMGQQVIIVADHTKCGRVATTFVAPITAIQTLVTDSLTPPEFVTDLTNSGVHVIAV